jgi:hypothetical protein
MNIALQMSSAGAWKTRIYFVKRNSEEKWCLLRAKSCGDCNNFDRWQTNVKTAAKPTSPFLDWRIPIFFGHSVVWE